MLVIAHRGNVKGPDPATENSLDAIRAALAAGWAVETDIRREPSSGRFYIAHDAASWSAGTDATAHAALWREHGGRVALNLKELGYESALVSFLAERKVRDQVVVFDMELLESRPGVTARRLRGLDPYVTVAARVSDRGESVARALAIEVAAVVWLDEFDRLWATADDVEQIRDTGRQVWAVSPELHGFSLDDMRRRWDDFHAWGVDGICTDHAAALAAQVAG
jgi:glycerophosphoryl diester phosphodiesterase